MTSPLIQLENALTKLDYFVDLLHGFLNESDETTKPIDTFLFGIYSNSLAGNNWDRAQDIDTQLRGIYLTLNTLLNDDVLVSDLRGIYQSIPDGEKTTYFRGRLQVVIETCNSIFDKIMLVEEHTAGLAPSIKAIKERTKPAYIDRLIEKTEDEGKHRYIECLPKTLHIAKAVIWFLPNIREKVAYIGASIVFFRQECYVPPKSKPVLSLIQIAYLYRYLGVTINERNKNEIAVEYCHIANNAGQRIYGHYQTIGESGQRTADGRDVEKNIQTVLDYLKVHHPTATAAIDQATKELETVKGRKK